MNVPPDRVSDLVAFVHVADVRRSVDFYALLGFDVRDTYEYEDRLDWAFLQAGEARLMVAHAHSPIDPGAQAVLFYLYSRDLDGLRTHLLSRGVHVGEIVDGTPGPRREMALSDPDGYCLMIAQLEG
jgi:catechol 2,3-dioxygenase-like lactoylglutathione lyase family enzyme